MGITKSRKGNTSIDARGKYPALQVFRLVKCNDDRKKVAANKKNIRIIEKTVRVKSIYNSLTSQNLKNHDSRR